MDLMLSFLFWSFSRAIFSSKACFSLSAGFPPGWSCLTYESSISKLSTWILYPATSSSSACFEAGLAGVFATFCYTGLASAGFTTLWTYCYYSAGLIGSAYTTDGYGRGSCLGLTGWGAFTVLTLSYFFADSFIFWALTDSIALYMIAFCCSSLLAYWSALSYSSIFDNISALARSSS